MIPTIYMTPEEIAVALGEPLTEVKRRIARNVRALSEGGCIHPFAQPPLFRAYESMRVLYPERFHDGPDAP